MERKDAMETRKLMSAVDTIQGHIMKTPDGDKKLRNMMLAVTNNDKVVAANHLEDDSCVILVERENRAIRLRKEEIFALLALFTQFSEAFNIDVMSGASDWLSNKDNKIRILVQPKIKDFEPIKPSELPHE